MALADHPAPAPYHAPAPSYHPAPAYKRPSYHEPEYKDTNPEYNFQYAVKDDYANVDFDAAESRNGYATSGGYRVALPDGRVQHVTYTVSDGYSGYVADVSYSGEAQYPPHEPKPSYRPAPAYKPAPAYHPRPAYPAPHA